MIKLIWNLLALIGFAMVAGLVWLAITSGFGMQNVKDLQNLKDFDPMATQVYMDMTKILLATGNGAEATVWKRPVAEGLSAEDVEETMRFVANEHNFKNVGELPLSELDQCLVCLACSLRCWQYHKIQGLLHRLFDHLTSLLPNHLFAKTFAYQSLDPVTTNGMRDSFFGDCHTEAMAQYSIGPCQDAETVVAGTIWLLKNPLEVGRS